MSLLLKLGVFENFAIIKLQILEEKLEKIIRLETGFNFCSILCLQGYSCFNTVRKVD